MDASRKFESDRERETKGRKAPVPEPRESEQNDGEEFSLDLSDLGPSHVVEERRASKVLGHALPLAFSDADLGESPAPERASLVARQDTVNVEPTHSFEASSPKTAHAPPTPEPQRAPEPIAETLDFPSISSPSSAPRTNDVRSSDTRSSESRTHFSTSVGQVRPRLASEDDDVAPEDIPHAREVTDAKNPLFAELRQRIESLAKGAVAATERHLRTLDVARKETRKVSKPRKKSPPALFGRLDPRYRGPAAGVLGILVVYAGVAHLLGNAPWSETTPGVPDLGASFGNSPAPEARAAADSPQRNFRIEGDGKPGETRAPKEAIDEESAPKGSSPVFETEAFPEGTSFPGKSLLEVVTSEEELIYVDGVFIGRGPLRRMPLSEGRHAVAIRSGGSQRSGEFDAPAGKMVRASFVSLPEEPSAE